MPSIIHLDHGPCEAALPRDQALVVANRPRRVGSQRNDRRIATGRDRPTAQIGHAVNVKLVLVEPYFDLKTPNAIGRETGPRC